MSRPSRARGLKRVEVGRVVTSDESRPSRARGLKLRYPGRCLSWRGSRPSRGRGLKRPCLGLQQLEKVRRAPHGRVD